MNSLDFSFSFLPIDMKKKREKNPTFIVVLKNEWIRADVSSTRRSIILLINKENRIK
jgi:hypothetical protein